MFRREILCQLLTVDKTSQAEILPKTAVLLLYFLLDSTNTAMSLYEITFVVFLFFLRPATVSSLLEGPGILVLYLFEPPTSVVTTS